MTLEELKKAILDKSLNLRLLIFVCEDNYWLANEYIEEISKIKELNVYSHDDVNDLSKSSNDFFFDELVGLNVAKIDKLNTNIENIEELTNCIIVCSSVDKDIREELKDYIVDFPKLVDWQVVDYAKIRLKGMEEDAIKWLCQIANYDINRIDNEIDKIAIFDEKDRMNIFLELNNDNCYSDLNDFNIFNLINAISRKEYQNVLNVLKIIDIIDVEPMGLITLLIGSFKKMIDVHLGNNSDFKKLGMSQKQFNAIKYGCNKFTANQLIDNYQLLVSIDYKLKSGLLDNNKIIDYVVCNILK